MYSNKTLSNSWLDDRTISDALVQCQVQCAPGLSGSPLSTDASTYADTASPSPLSFPEMLSIGTSLGLFVFQGGLIDSKKLTLTVPRAKNQTASSPLVLSK